MELYIISFLAGMLTVLTPCVLPVLPVILGGSLSGQDRWRPLIITSSLIVSIFAFTFFLKASTALIDIPPSFWTTIAGGIVLLFGLTLVFPDTWSSISQKLGLTKSEGLLQKASQQGGKKGMVFLGVALGPVFASCSPTYALILAVVLPQNFAMGFWAMIVYCLGLFVPLFLIAYGGRKVLGGFRWFANPTSWFRKGLGILLIVVGIAVFTGLDKKAEEALLNQGYIDFTKIEQQLLESYEGAFDVEDEEMEMINEMAKNQDAKMMEENVSEEDQRALQLLNQNYPAPELVNPQNWINSDALTLAQLQAENKVVVIDFWTYSCINCIRTLPALRALHDSYADQGLVILGVHAPEFAFERRLENVQNKVAEYQLEYPIFLDNDFETWRAYENRYWPAKYIIDADGQVRYTHFGEGAYEETEEVIRYLLKEANGSDEMASSDMIDFSVVESPSRGVGTGETYLGTQRHVVGGTLEAKSPKNRQAVFVSPEPVSEEGERYSQPESVSINQWWLTGDWQFDGEKIVSQSQQASLGIVYEAAQANLVMGFTNEPVDVEIWLDGEQIPADDAGRMLEDGQVSVDDFQLYYLSEHPQVEEHTLELRFNGEGVEAYAWTFG